MGSVFNIKRYHFNLPRLTVFRYLQRLFAMTSLNVGICEATVFINAGDDNKVVYIFNGDSDGRGCTNIVHTMNPFTRGKIEVEKASIGKDEVLVVNDTQYINNKVYEGLERFPGPVNIRARHRVTLDRVYSMFFENFKKHVGIRSLFFKLQTFCNMDVYELGKKIREVYPESEGVDVILHNIEEHVFRLKKNGTKFTFSVPEWIGKELEIEEGVY